jgi:PIN domain nuclease of toxin-antitoxin system
MNAPLLLDTCAAIWLARAEEIGDEAIRQLEEAFDAGTPAYVSPITAWEIGMLVSRRRLSLLISPQLWFQQLFDVLNFRMADMAPNILIESAFLPGTPPNDPADRILAATAREYGYILVTRDRPLLEYAEHGHMQAIAC